MRAEESFEVLGRGADVAHRIAPCPGEDFARGPDRTYRHAFCASDDALDSSALCLTDGLTDGHKQRLMHAPADDDEEDFVLIVWNMSASEYARYRDAVVVQLRMSVADV